MPVPNEYQRIKDHFYAFLVDARDEAGLGSTHQSYTMVEGVFRAFRRRLDLEQSIVFANSLPAGLRALFVSNWDPRQRRLSFGARADMVEEVQALRAPHNFAPDTAIDDVSRALRRHVDLAEFDRQLRELGPESQRFWSSSS